MAAPLSFLVRVSAPLHRAASFLARIRHLCAPHPLSLHPFFCRRRAHPGDSDSLVALLSTCSPPSPLARTPARTRVRFNTPHRFVPALCRCSLSLCHHPLFAFPSFHSTTSTSLRVLHHSSRLCSLTRPTPFAPRRSLCVDRLCNPLWAVGSMRREKIRSATIREADGRTERQTHTQHVTTASTRTHTPLQLRAPFEPRTAAAPLDPLGDSLATPTADDRSVAVAPQSAHCHSQIDRSAQCRAPVTGVVSRNGSTGECADWQHPR